MKTLLRLIALTFSVSSLAAAPDAPASVTLPMGEYLQLKKFAEAPSLKMIEQVTLSGQFGKKLVVEFSGSSPKKWDRKVVADSSTQFSFTRCRGQAYLDRENDQVVLVPKEESFKLTCDVEVTNWASFELGLHNVLALRSEVTGAQPIIENGDGGSKRVTYVAETGARRNVAADVSTVGRYRISKLPDGQRFRYQFALNNPGRSIRTFTVNLPNGEEVQQITSDQTYTENANGVTFSLIPGETEVTVEGKYTRADFSPLLESQQQYLLLESHPSLQLNVTATAKRIAVTDSGIDTNFRNATAYLFGKDGKLSWVAKELELVASLGFSVESASYVYYVPETGRSLVEASFSILNQGTPEIPLKIDGTPTYVEVDGVGEPLYRDAKGNLLLRLPSGQHNVLVQYQAPHAARGIATQFAVPLVRPDTVLSNVQLSLGTPAKWRLLYGVSLFHPESEFSLSLLLAAAIAFGLMFFLGVSAKTKKSYRWMTALSSGAIAFLKPELLPLLFVAASAGVLTRYRAAIWQWIVGRSRWAAVIGLSAVVGVGVIAVVSLVLVQGGTRHERASYAPSASAPKISKDMRGSLEQGADDDALDAEGGAEFGSPESASPVGELAGAGGNYVGMPARIKLPYPTRQVAFQQQLVDRATPLYAEALFLSAAVFEWLALAVGLLGLFSLYQERRSIRAWLRV